jgi:hypothetical protein
VATSAQIHALVSRGAVQRYLRRGQIVKIWPGIYSERHPNRTTRLNGLDLRCGETVAIGLGTAAAVYGFDTEETDRLHVLNPVGCRLRDGAGLVVHRRDGAPLTCRRGRLLTTPAWTAIEVGRGLERPRALATLDAALRSGTCDSRELYVAAEQQAGRRNVAIVRDLIPLARPGAESPMESEARLVMLDGGLPEPVLQYEIVDRDGRLWRVDFAWPEQRVIVEYDGFDWHSSRQHLLRDRQKRAALQELNWRVLSIVSDDVRRQPAAMLRRIDSQLSRSAPSSSAVTPSRQSSRI